MSLDKLSSWDIGNKTTIDHKTKADMNHTHHYERGEGLNPQDWIKLGKESTVVAAGEQWINEVQVWRLQGSDFWRKNFFFVLSVFVICDALTKSYQKDKTYNI